MAIGDLPLWLPVPAGAVTLGVAPPAAGAGQPSEHLDVPAFWITRTPVTNARYAAWCVASGTRRAAPLAGGRTYRSPCRSTRSPMWTGSPRPGMRRAPVPGCPANWNGSAPHGGMMPAATPGGIRRRRRCTPISGDSSVPPHRLAPPGRAQPLGLRGHGRQRLGMDQQPGVCRIPTGPRMAGRRPASPGPRVVRGGSYNHSAPRHPLQCA
jgi:hypothetical protein